MALETMNKTNPAAAMDFMKFSLLERILAQGIAR
jgi:hypothetical protein